MTSTSDISKKQLRFRWYGVAVVLVLWTLLSAFAGEIVVATPLQAFRAFCALLFTREFWQTVAVTGWRFLAGFSLGVLTGGVFALFYVYSPLWERLCEPVHWLLMSIPPVVLVMISMMLFGMGTVQTIVVSALLITPIMYTNTLDGLKSIDPELLHMGKLYGAKRSLLIREIYLPGIAGHLVSALTLSAGLGIRIVVLAEVLGAYSGVGHCFSLARTNLETDKLYAWVLVCLAVVGGLEFLLFRPLKQRMGRWREESEDD